MPISTVAADCAALPLPSFEEIIPTTEPHGPDFEQIPADLKALPQWVCWRLEKRAGDPTKVPYNAESGRRARSNDPTTWTTFDTAVNAYLRGGHAGIGFMFWEGDGLTGLDLDHVIDLQTGEIDPRALEILERFKGTYCEISPSGTGFRIFTRGSPGRSGKNEGHGKWLEVYTHPSHRYLTVTGHHWPQSAVEIAEQQSALDWLHEKYFTKPAAPKPATTPSLGIDDTALLDKARAAANGHQFGQLWNGDTTTHRGDHSSADLALCSLLAFWTGKDAGRMDRLFRQSGLMRPKWERADYRQRTIDKAIAECLEVYTEGSKGKGGNGHDHAPPSDYSGYPEAHGYQTNAGPEPERPGRKSTYSQSAPNPWQVEEAELGFSMLSDVKARPIEWLWRPYVPLRANTLFCGDSDVGKSKAIASIISTVTRGSPFPMTTDVTRARSAIVLSAEEDTASMLKPSLLAAGADPSKIAVVDSCAEFDAKGKMKRRMVTLERDVERIRALAHRLGDVGLIVIDPVTAYLGTRIDSNNNSAIRAVLMDLQALAEEHDAACILVTHPGKDASKNAKLAVLGATAFVAGVRSVIGFYLDPDDPTQNRRLMIPVKCNLVPRAERQGRAFTIVGETVTDGDDTPIHTAAVRWLDEVVTRTADEIRHAAQAQQGRELSEEREDILTVLRHAGHPLTSRRIAEAVHDEEIPDHSDSRRVKVRRLLGKMLADSQICQLPDRSYTLPLCEETGNSSSSSSSGNSGNSGNSSNSGNSGNRFHIKSNRAVTGYRLPAVTDNRAVTAEVTRTVKGNCNDCRHLDPCQAGCRLLSGVIPMEQRATPPCNGADFEPKDVRS